MLSDPERVVRGAFWSLLDIAGGQGLSLLVFLVMTPLLDPGDYGIYAIASSVFLIGWIPLTQGLADGVVQRKTIDDLYLSTAFWANLALAVVFLGILQLVASPMAALFGMPKLELVLRVMSLLYLSSACTVQFAYFRRHLEIRAFALRTVVSNGLGGVVGVVMAFEGYGIWSLVAFQLIQAPVTVALVLKLCPWTPSLIFSWACLRETFRFGLGNMAGNLVVVSATKTDVLLIGAFLDARTLGYYALASRLIQILASIIFTPASTVALPLLSSRAHDGNSFLRAYAQIVGVAHSVLMPSVAGLAIISASLFPFLFGPRWVGAVPVFQAMAGASLTMALWGLTGSALVGMGKTGWFALLALLQITLLMAGVALTAPHGIVAVGWGYSAVSLLLAGTHLLLLSRLIDLRLGPVLWDWLRVTLAGAGMVGSMLAGVGSGSVAQILVGATTYLLLLLVTMPGYIGRLFGLVHGSWRRYAPDLR